jgi:hypothetical protein
LALGIPNAKLVIQNSKTPPRRSFRIETTIIIHFATEYIDKPVCIRFREETALILEKEE